MSNFMDRLKTSWNILTRPDNDFGRDLDSILTSSFPSGAANHLQYDTSKSTLAPILSRLSVDVAAIPIRHVIVDENEKFVERRVSELNDRLSIMANLDQTGTAFIQDAAMTMLSHGACVLVPVEISANPKSGNGYDILTMRVGRVSQWYNNSVEVSIYNEKTGQETQKLLPKGFVAIAYNPMYTVMNAPNSTLKRLIDRLALLDSADNRTYSTQLDLILQLPFTLKSERRAEEAERRLAILEAQLQDRKYGVAYIDATEKIHQLNRPASNQLFTEITTLNETLHNQLGLTPSIFSGTASQEEVVLYNNRTILPIVKSLTESMRTAFFSRTAIRQGHSVLGFPKLFKMAPLLEFADAADKLTRNEIMTSNEVRAEVGLPPSDDPEADKLRNKNLNKSEPMDTIPSTEEAVPEVLPPSDVPPADDEYLGIPSEVAPSEDQGVLVYE